MVRCKVHNGTAFTGNARIIVKDINAAKAGNRFLNIIFDLFFVCQISTKQQRALGETFFLSSFF